MGPLCAATDCRCPHVVSDRPRRGLRPARGFRPWATAWLALLPLFLGCSPWQTAALENRLLKPPRMSPDTVILEMAVVDVADAEQLWQELDEQHLPLETRRKLAAEGLRAGLLGSHLPDWINQELAREARSVEVDACAGEAVVQDGARQWRLQCRSGDPREIELGAVRNELVISSKCPESPDEEVFELAQSKLSLIAEPQGDGRVHLTITPEIHHGPLRHRWVGDDGTFRMDLGRERRKYPELGFTAKLAPGQTLVITAPPDVEGLGATFFRNESSRKQRILLFRLAQTQFDDLFSPPKKFTPIASRGR